MIAIGFQQTAAAEIMRFAGYQIIGKTVAGIEMCHIQLVRSIDCNKDAFSLKISLDHALLIGQNGNLQASVTKRLAFTMRVREPPNQIGQRIFLRLLEEGPQCRIALFFFSPERPIRSRNIRTEFPAFQTKAYIPAANATDY